MSALTEEMVESFLAEHPGRWFKAGEIVKGVLSKHPKETKSVVYLAVSNLYRKHKRIARRGEGHMKYEYSHDHNVAPLTNRVLRKTERQDHPIHWKMNEKLNLAAEYIKIRKELPYLPKSATIDMMQRVLPPERRRVRLSHANIPWLDDYIAKVKSNPNIVPGSISVKRIILPGNVSLKPEETFSGPPKPKYDIFDHIRAREDALSSESKKEAEPIEPQKAAEPVEVTDPAKKLASLESFGIDEIFAEAVKRLGSPIKSLIVGLLSDLAVKDALSIRTDVHVHHHHHHYNEKGEEFAKGETAEFVERRAEARPQKIKIGVVSNRTDIESELVKSFPQVKFVVTDRKYHEAADAVKSCDKVMLLTKFISHSTQNNVKSTVGDKLTMINGGLSEVKRQINIWINQGLIPKQ